jgi:hypothetical protein
MIGKANLDTNYYLEGREVHWATYGWKKHIYPALGVLLILFALAQFVLIPYRYVSTVVMILIGCYWIFRKYFLGLKYAKKVQKQPTFGEEMSFKIKDGFLYSNVGSSESKFDLETAFKIVTSINGILIYPQKEIYLYIPKSALDVPEEYYELEEYLRDSFGATAINTEQSAVAIQP